MSHTAATTKNTEQCETAKFIVELKARVAELEKESTDQKALITELEKLVPITDTHIDTIKHSYPTMDVPVATRSDRKESNTKTKSTVEKTQSFKKRWTNKKITRRTVQKTLSSLQAKDVQTLLDKKLDYQALPKFEADQGVVNPKDLNTVVEALVLLNEHTVAAV
jgi:hypothetical protein